MKYIRRACLIGVLVCILLICIIVYVSKLGADQPVENESLDMEEITETPETNISDMEDWMEMNSQLDNSNDSDILWLTVEGFSQLDSIDVPIGTVEISEKLRSRLSEYSDETIFAVAICFAPMIPDDYLDRIEYEGLSATEYLEKSIELQESNPEEAKKALGKYYELKYSYYDEILSSLSYDGEKLTPAFACKERFFFYTYMSREEILHLKCAENEALYIFAPGMVM